MRFLLTHINHEKAFTFCRSNAKLSSIYVSIAGRCFTIQLLSSTWFGAQHGYWWSYGFIGWRHKCTLCKPGWFRSLQNKRIVLSPGVVFNKNKAEYRGTDTKSNKSSFDLGTSGLVIGFNTPNSKWTNQTFSFGISQTANFNNLVSYGGLNNQSSYAEQYAEQFSQSGLSIDEALNNPRFAYGTAPALYTYLVDVFRNSSDTTKYSVKALPEFLLENEIALQQQKTIQTTGGIYELALGYAANMDDRFYLGGSLGIPIVDYERFTKYRRV